MPIERINLQSHGNDQQELLPFQSFEKYISRSMFYPSFWSSSLDENGKISQSFRSIVLYFSNRWSPASIMKLEIQASKSLIVSLFQVIKIHQISWEIQRALALLPLPRFYWVPNSIAPRFPLNRYACSFLTVVLNLNKYIFTDYFYTFFNCWCDLLWDSSFDESGTEDVHDDFPSLFRSIYCFSVLRYHRQRPIITDDEYNYRRVLGRYGASISCFISSIIDVVTVDGASLLFAPSTIAISSAIVSLSMLRMDCSKLLDSLPDFLLPNRSYPFFLESDGKGLYLDLDSCVKSMERLPSFRSTLLRSPTSVTDAENLWTYFALIKWLFFIRFQFFFMVSRIIIVFVLYSW